MDRTERLLAIALKLEAGAWRRAEDLAEMFGVSVRTIYRDMQLLDETGLPVAGVRGKGYRLAEGRPPVTFDDEEAVALLRGCELVVQQGSPADRAAAERAQAKIERVLPGLLRERLARRRRSEAARPANIFDDAEERALLGSLYEAIDQQHAVRFRHTDRPDSTLTVYPYGLVTYGGVRHMVGSRRPEGRVQAFPLAATNELEVLDETFERPEGYRSTTHVRGAHRYVTVRVRFGGDAARWVQDALPPFADHVEPVADGIVVVLKVQREAEAQPWLLSWGSHAHVLQPDSLKRRVAQEARRIAERYREAPMLL